MPFSPGGKHDHFKFGIASTPPARRRRASPGRLQRGTFGAIDPARLITVEGPCQEPPEACARAATPHELRVLASLAVARLRAAHLSSRRVTKPPRYCCKRCEQKIPSIGLPIFCTASGSSGATPARRPPILWAGPEAEAASTRAGATARRPAACCPSRRCLVTGTGTTAARTATTSTNKDSGASPRTPTATRPCSSSRTTLIEENLLRSLHY